MMGTVTIAEQWLWVGGGFVCIGLVTVWYELLWPLVGWLHDKWLDLRD